MQILSAIFPSVTWSQYLPPGLVQFVKTITTLFTIDFSALFTSPVCGAEATMRGQWAVRVMIPIALAGILLLWALFAKCWVAKKDKDNQKKNIAAHFAHCCPSTFAWAL